MCRRDVREVRNVRCGDSECGVDFATRVDDAVVRHLSHGDGSSGLHASCNCIYNLFAHACDGFVFSEFECESFRRDDDIFLLDAADPFGRAPRGGLYHLVYGNCCYGEQQCRCQEKDSFHLTKELLD